MAELVARVSVLIGGAFALGLAVGWAFWRFGRRSVPLGEWLATRHEAAELRRQVELAAAGRDALAAVVGGSRQEVFRLTELVTANWQERTALRHHLGQLDAELARRLAELEQARTLTEHLQRRVLELNGLAVRALDVEHQPLARPRVVPPGGNGAFPPVVPGPSWDTPVGG